MTDPRRLRARTDGLMLTDRDRLRRRVDRAARIEAPDRRVDTLRRIDAEIGAAEERVARRRAAVPPKIAYPEELPITAHREALLRAIADHQVVIVAGETGSGKSTQLPKLCLELGRGITGTIGHTQPRRIAARSIAERVAEELGVSIGSAVGYTMRFTDRVGEDTLVKVMTDGILLNEIHHDRLLRAYDTIIIDEAHERSLNIDFLLGYLAALLPRRPDLKLVITSATIDTEKFSAHFDDAPVVEVSGRSYPVEIRYRPLDDPTGEPRDQPQAICDAVVELTSEGTGDILVFCSGEREIRDAEEAIAELALPHTELLPLFGRLSAAEQHRVFQPHTGRRIVLATNVAETSLTVPGIRSVVDPGAARISRWSRRTKVQRLPIEPISRASADQRAGRCGRIGPGVCVRLYTRDDYEARPAFTEPEIQRTNLASVILQMAALELGDIESFPFVDPPDARAIRDGIALLEELGAVDPSRRRGSKGWLTETGRRLARLPIDLRLGRMILDADRNACLAEVLVIASALSIQDPRIRPPEQAERADELHRRFADPDSDLLSWLHLWEHLHGERRARSSSAFRRLCRDEFLDYRRVREWQDVHGQLRRSAGDLGMTRNRRPAEPEAIHRSVLTGLLSHVGHRDPDGYEYRGARGIRFSLSPGSVLFRRAPDWVMAAELVETGRTWAHQVARIRPEWVEEAAGGLVRRSHSDPWWDADLGAAVARETVTLFGLPLVTDRIVLASRTDPDAARELFIRHALVGGEWETHHRFAAHNREMIGRVLEMETRARRTDLLVSDDDLEAFFDRRLPRDIGSVAAFDAWWKDARSRDPHLLDLTLEDLLEPSVEPPSEDAFPTVWRHGDVAMPITYEWDPASPTDGITVDVPAVGLDRVDPSVFDWQVPGFREELVTALLRSLPKRLRKPLVPIPDTAREIVARHDPASGPLLPFLRREVSARIGEPVPPDAFDPGSLPAHLRPRFRVVDESGAVLAAGDDLSAIKAGLGREVREAVAATGHELERQGIVEWDFGELPDTLEVGPEGHRVRAFPALVDEVDSVAIRLVATREEQSEAMWDGTRRLLRLSLPSAARLLRPMLDERARAALRAGPYETPSEWTEDCLQAALDGILAAAGGPPRDGVGFDRLRARARDELADRVTEVGSASLAVFDAVLRLEGLAGRLEAAFPEVVEDVATQVNRLVYPGFVTALGAGRLHDVVRYLEAAEWRMERVAEDPLRDRERMERIRSLEAEHDRLLDLLPWTPDLVEVGWMLQELRVSLFAQAIGTRGTVSEKRVARALHEAAMGA